MPAMRLPFDPIAEARRNWDAAGWGGTDAMAAVVSIVRAHQLALARIDEALLPHGLTFSRFEALALLDFSRKGALPMGKIGQRLQVHPASVTNTINRLAEDGLVERRPDSEDGRTVLAAITPAGRRLVNAAAESLVEIDFGLQGLGAAEFERLERDLRFLRLEAGDFSEA